MTTATIIADSMSPAGVRLTTMVLEYPRIIHSEFMTHRMFSRNASSSRAIPVHKQLERIENDPFIPKYWGRNQPGMQAGEDHNEIVKLPYYYPDNGPNGFKTGTAEVTKEQAWKRGRNQMMEIAQGLLDAGYHKQIPNRLLEPFAHIQVVVTATEWDNFFNLRDHPAAEPHIQELARAMKETIEASEPAKLKVRDYHLPFIVSTDTWWDDLAVAYGDDYANAVLLKVSVARCARVSYGLNERLTTRDIEEDIKLHDSLLVSGHFSPFEHIASPMLSLEPAMVFYLGKQEWKKGVTHMDRNGDMWSGNFKDWIQYRQLVAQ